jgi:hypothetical protein
LPVLVLEGARLKAAERVSGDAKLIVHDDPRPVVRGQAVVRNDPRSVARAQATQGIWREREPPPVGEIGHPERLAHDPLEPVGDLLG